ncbi:MAG: SRPBCC domain-containing protein [Elusimicrobiota bacterium]|nr:SRPBCC domain-containing protein [Elusimicrobiota bacterium]
MPSAETTRLSTRDIRLTATIRAKPELVYRSLTSARELTRWWLEGAETDARNAGRLRMIWPRPRAKGGSRCPGFGEREGVFVDLEPARKVAWLWKPARGEKGVPALASIFILPARGGKSEVTLLHAGFAAAARVDALYDAYARAWEDGLAKVKLYLETGRTCKLECLDLEAVRIITTRSRR